MADTQDKCPVDHAAVARKAATDAAARCPVDHAADQGAHGAPAAEACPVDHSARSSWATVFGSSAPAAHTHPHGNVRLPTDRETSTIPRSDGTKWVYPSQAQFYAAMERKSHNPHAPDMKVIVPIHNAVNERAWSEVMRWEEKQGGEKCAGPKLVSFKGRPNDRTPRARWRMLLGYSAPFDRHDWVVDRCGTRIRYVIDFYTGRSGSSPNNNISFYLDVRPALDSWEGVRLRASRVWDRWTGFLRSPSTPSEPTKPQS